MMSLLLVLLAVFFLFFGDFGPGEVFAELDDFGDAAAFGFFGNEVRYQVTEAAHVVLREAFTEFDDLGVHTDRGLSVPS